MNKVATQVAFSLIALIVPIIASGCQSGTEGKALTKQEQEMMRQPPGSVPFPADKAQGYMQKVQQEQNASAKGAPANN